MARGFYGPSAGLNLEVYSPAPDFVSGVALYLGRGRFGAFGASYYSQQTYSYIFPMNHGDPVGATSRVSQPSGASWTILFLCPLKVDYCQDLSQSAVGFSQVKHRISCRRNIMGSPNTEGEMTTGKVK